MFKRRIYRTWGMKMHQSWARLLHDRLKDLVITPEIRRCNQAHNWDDEAHVFEEDAFNNPDSETYYYRED